MAYPNVRHPLERQPLWRRALRWLARGALALLLVLSGVVAALALWYQLPAGDGWRGAAGAAWFIGAAVVAWRALTGRGRRALAAYALAAAALCVWWSGIAPSNDRPWADDVARQLQGSVAGDIVTLHNVRNFDWRSDSDYTVRWETRRYDLARLRTIDTALSYWMGPAIAHTLVSFGFDDGHGGLEHVAFSVEIRKERGESFSALAGFFKRFEVALVAADERDVLRVRTNVRGEDVYLYSVAMPPAAMRSLFLAYVDEAAALRRTPRFYDTLTANCTTIVFDMVRHIVPGLPLDYRLLASGYLPGYLYDLGALAPGHALEELHAAGRITLRARQDGGTARFSAAIRAGVPEVTVARP